MIFGNKDNMFDSICINLKNKAGNENLENVFDFGFLAEAMLFYQNVQVIARRGFLELLVQKFQPDVLLNYLEAGFLKISYLENDTGIYTENTGTIHEKHKPILWSIPDYNWEKHSRDLFSKALGLTKKGARRYSIQVSRYIKPLEIERSVEFETIQDFSNGKYIEQSITHLLKYFVPEYELPIPLIFTVTTNGTHFFVDTNINFTIANEHYHKRVSPKHSSLTSSYLLSNLVAARSDWYFSSLFSSEIATNEISNTVFSLKFNDLLSNRQRSNEQIDVFKDYVFDDARTISEVINSGEKSFRDLYYLLIEADKFKSWLKEQEPDQELFRAYFQEVTKKSWVDKLPPKSIRWAIFNLAGLGIDTLGAGGIGKVAGLTVSAFDEFLVDKILKGWKPNQFIETSKRQFLNEHSKMQ